MSVYRFSERFLAFLFVAALLAFSCVNLHTQGKSIAAGAALLEAPVSLGGMKKYLAGVESAINANVWRKFDFIEAYAYLQVLMGKEENGGFDSIKDKGGQMIYGNFYPRVPVEIEECARRIFRLANYAGKRGGKVMFLGTSSTYVRGVSNFSSGLPANDANPDLDAMMYFLHAFGVDYLDSRSVLARSKIPARDHQYRTDHHWTIEASFEVFKALISKLNGEYGANLDPDGYYRDIDNYNVIYYPDSFLGSLGVKSGAAFSGVDGFTMIWPKFRTDFERVSEISSTITQKNGPLEETVLDPRYITTNFPYLASLYTAYGEMPPFRKIRNRMKPDGLKLLMIHDSYSNPIISFLAPMFGEIHAIWPATPDGKFDIDKYISENDFDYIIIEIYPGSFGEEVFYFCKKPMEE
jgi:hypothetical protein